MSSGVIAGIGTLLLTVGFIAFVAWVFSPWQKRRWDESARLPFEGDDNGKQTSATDGGSVHE